MVSIMHVNNETGVVQPIEEIGAIISQHPAYFHVDAAQGFGKIIEPLQSHRLDLVSVSAHKIYGPKGVGALIARRRGFKYPPLTPLMMGGGHERSLRPGTLPVPLIVGLGAAARLAGAQALQRTESCRTFRVSLLKALMPLTPVFTGDQGRVISSSINLRFPGVDAEAIMVALKGLVAISNGSACTSASYSSSHVLRAMGFSEEEAEECIRMSWCHMTPEPDWAAIATAIAELRA